MATVTDDAQALLLEGIVTKWSGEGSLTGAMSGPHLHNKPAQAATTEDYFVIEPGESIDDGWTCRNKYWRHEFDFRVFGKTPEAANVNLNLFLAVFAAEDLTLSLPIGGLVMHRVVSVSYVQEEQQSVEFASCRIKFRTYVPRP